jgi:hypothetical protein
MTLLGARAGTVRRHLLGPSRCQVHSRYPDFLEPETLVEVLRFRRPAEREGLLEVLSADRDLGAAHI